jgi:NAD(P)-dependent dehydrogenase (short-subunit alcohol dehydrogenase family)
MEIFVTGGAGLIGRAVASYLLEQGYRVRLTDLVAETDAPQSKYAVCDIMNYEQVVETMRGCDAVIHLAALKNPMVGLSHDVFRINTVGTFHVFEAAAKHGIKRIAQASSINAIGCAWNIADFSPDYLPIDEDHPSVTTDAYSLSKKHVEEIGDYYWRREGISSVALRLPGIYQREKRLAGDWSERQQTMRDFLDSFLQLPEEEQKQQMAAAREAIIAHRMERPLEYPNAKWDTPQTDKAPELLLRAYMFDRYNLWASLDERDAARAFELSIRADFEGSHVLFVSDKHNSHGYDSQTLARLFFPNVPANLSGSESLVSTKRASELIGFEPQYSLSGAKHDKNR